MELIYQLRHIKDLLYQILKYKFDNQIFDTRYPFYLT